MAVEKKAYTVPLLVNGMEIYTSSVFQVVSPVDGTGLLWQSSSVTQAEALAAVHAARDAFPAWSISKPAFRRDILLRAADILQTNSAEYQAYMKQETGASTMFAKFNLTTSCEIIRDCAGRISGALVGAVPPTEDNETQAMVFKEPYGVVLGIAPWSVSATIKDVSLPSSMTVLIILI